MDTLWKWLILQNGLDSEMRASAPTVWYRMNEASGTTILNYGSLASANLTASNATLGAPALKGRLGITYNGTTTSLSNGSIATLGTHTALTYMVIAKALSAGDLNQGRLFSLDWSGGGKQRRIYINSANLDVAASIATATTDAIAVSNTGAIQLNMWYAYFMTYDDADDRKPHIYLGRSGKVNEVSYASQGTAAAALAASATARMTVGNIAGVVTWDGTIDEAACWGRVLSTAEMARLVRAAGV